MHHWEGTIAKKHGEGFVGVKKKSTRFGCAGGGGYMTGDG